ncbi:MAG: phosphoribosyltransferase family protein [Nitrososphaerales archaeon]|jgi:adenine phosphoribosyltransferase
MNPSGAVRRYSGQRTYRVALSEISRELPLVQISQGVYIASDAELILGDVEFLSTAARLLARKLRKLDIDVVLTAEAKSIALAYELSRRLRHDRFVVARKSAKAYVDHYFSQKVKSITTKAEQQLLLTSEDLASLSGKRVCLLDDVVSTGATFTALEGLAKEAGASVACRAAIWKEGPWYTGKDLVCLGQLPIFVSEASLLAKRIH